ncbi:unnamed protein product [Clavelina lepadiformis]|uniref:Uncharacterized protein n=1 Tax=Clavelina lepadiformis TaxID=159417 RepID=A0ABP0G221_CLALP
MESRRYHDEGLCELGPNCNLINEEKHNYVSTLDPTVPEFLPCTAQKSFMPSENFNHWDDILSCDETCFALPTGCGSKQIPYDGCLAEPFGRMNQTNGKWKLIQK